MKGPTIDDGELAALGGWLFALPAPPKLGATSDASARGGALFAARCSTCHSGPMMTNNATVDVGTGGAYQVPSLVGVGWRSAFLHTGCAASLAQRFDPACGGDRHGATADLTAAQLDDVVQFLQTL